MLGIIIESTLKLKNLTKKDLKFPFHAHPVSHAEASSLRVAASKLHASPVRGATLRSAMRCSACAKQDTPVWCEAP
jgi:hypothetical protein